tara:strand:- start:23 stop:628 length:606 start_codon:yes stop_codon:yes gene_type:complete
MSFYVSNPVNQIEKNKSLLNFNSNTFVSWGLNNWDGKTESWLGRGHGITGSDYISRFITPFNSKITKIVFYFDKEINQNWPTDGVFKFQIHKEYPIEGTGTPSHPPCNSPSPGAGTGSQIIPSTSGEWIEFKKEDLICFNNGKDPRNGSSSQGLVEASYGELYVNITVDNNSAISVVIDGDLNLPNTAYGELSAEIYFENI